MSRTPDLVARQQLLDDIVRHLAARGLGDLTFRSVATALDTSVNRLVHHFGTRDELLESVLARVIDRHHGIEQAWLRRRPSMTQTDILRRWWRWMLATPDHLDEVRLTLEAATLHAAVTGLAPSVRADQIGTWRGDMERRLIAEGMPLAEARLEATLLKAGFSGVTLDLCATGDRRRNTAALYRMLDALDVRIARARTSRRVSW